MSNTLCRLIVLTGLVFTGLCADAATAFAQSPAAEEGRLRTGFNINGGALAERKAKAGVGGGTFRIGWQINRHIGVYGQLTHAVSVGSFLAQSLQSTPMFSVSPFDVLEVAAGPSLDLAAGSTFALLGRADGARVEEFSGAYFGLHGRLALHLHTRLRDEKTGWRKGFTLGFDVHPTFKTQFDRETIVSYTVGLGWDWM